MSQPVEGNGDLQDLENIQRTHLQFGMQEDNDSKQAIWWDLEILLKWLRTTAEMEDVPVSSCPDEGYSKLHSDCSLTCSRADLLYHLPPAAGHKEAQQHLHVLLIEAREQPLYSADAAVTSHGSKAAETVNRKLHNINRHQTRDESQLV
ncbi:hypothetical protein CHARACLAT_030500 [Characodon lateralis]|uniref:Uncharacterized protein n=1 Tax=Characodon lateralis TaxID=208331 RepID=A0ABU7DBE6_9TELE|nr:hypothetical protein [Characodon lateralis]